jgi:hypothetical protein
MIAHVCIANAFLSQGHKETTPLPRHRKTQHGRNGRFTFHGAPSLRHIITDPQAAIRGQDDVLPIGG